MRMSPTERTMLCFALLTLSLTAPIHGILPEIGNSEINQIIENNVAQGHATLNDMFVEVEQLMEDTQQKLEDAAHQIDNESARASLHPTNLPSHSNNESSSSGRSSADNTARNQSIQMTETVDKDQENRTSPQSSEEENNINHECIIDDDCQKGRYCLYETHQSRCLPCKALDVRCTKDEECCAGQLCVWGQCSQNNTKGEAGSICQHQSDCSPELCCAFHKALLFPVCLAKPIERERCYASSNHLMELLSWDMEGEGPREHCPCSGDLQCQPLGRGSMCLKSQNSSEEDLTDTLYSEVDYIV